MSAARLEAFLAKIYVDEESRERFLADPRGEATKAGLGEREVEALEKIDRAGLVLGARSIQRKRQRSHRHRRAGLLIRAYAFAKSSINRAYTAMRLSLVAKDYPFSIFNYPFFCRYRDRVKASPPKNE
jgi:hypothetical protein